MAESQAVPRALENTTIRSKIVNECLDSLRLMQEDSRVILELKNP